MRTQRVLSALATGTVIIGATACATSNTSQPASNSSSGASTLASANAVATTWQPRPAPAAGQWSACTDVGGTVDANQICHAHTDGPGYKVTFTFPVDHPDQQALSGYLTRRRDDFIAFTSDGPRMTGRTSWTPPRTRIDRVRLTPAPKAWFSTCTATRAAHIREFDKASDDYGPAGENTLGARVYENFALTDDAVIFFIGQGQWLPQVAGPREVSVPRTDLASVLA